MDMTGNIFSPGPFMPHGGCYLWTRSLIVLHAVSDAAIGLAYYSIPFTLLYFVRKRKDLEFHWVFVCFAAFVLACGTTHLMEIWNIWHADYWLSGGIKAVTALASLATAILLIKLVPQALALPSTADLRKSRDELDMRVRERTSELEQTARNLQAEITERRRVEIDLRRLAAIVESSDDAIISKDLEGNVTSWNRGAEKIFGYTAREMVGTSIMRLIPTDRHEEEAQILAKIKRGEIADHFETVRKTKDGRLLDVSVTASLIKEADGRIIGLSKVARDITGRKRAEAALAESEKSFRTLAEAMPQIVWIMRADGWNIYFNPRWVDYTGMTLEESHGHGWNKPFHPDDRQRGWDAWQNATTNIATYSLECRLRRADGAYHWWLIRGVPLQDAAGKILKWFGTCTDIEEIKQVEAALRASEIRYRRLFETTKDGILTLDAETGMVMEVNPFLIELLGFSREAFLGKKVWELGFFRDVVANRDNFAELQVKEYLRYEDMALETSDGRRVEVEFTSSVYLVDDQKVIQCNIRDITARTEAKEAIRKSNQSLEQRVRDRTAELEAANKELEAFSYSVSHDLRAPLRAMDGFSNIALSQHTAELSPEARDALRIVRDSSQQMGRLIDDLLVFSRLSRQPLRKGRVDPDRIVRECWETLRPEIEGRRVELTTGELPVCEADAALLKLVWMNLLSNALKYSRKSDPARIEIGCRPDGETVYFVRDNGVGFKMAYADKLFGVFQRLHRAEDYEGTGVGLATVQRIVHRHGGRIWAEAVPNEGATFFFTLEPSKKP